MVVATPDDLVNAVARDRRMVGYRVRRQGEGWIELETSSQRSRTAVMLVLVWPEVWRDRGAMLPHLIRARSGNYGLIVVGHDRELEEAQLDAGASPQQSAGKRPDVHGDLVDVDLTALTSPISMTRLLLTLRNRADAIGLRISTAALELELERSRHENDMLISIGRALSQERDIRSLLAIILKRACEVSVGRCGLGLYRRRSRRGCRKAQAAVRGVAERLAQRPAGWVHDAGVGVVDRRFVRDVRRS